METSSSILLQNLEDYNRLSANVSVVIPKREYDSLIMVNERIKESYKYSVVTKDYRFLPHAAYFTNDVKLKESLESECRMKDILGKFKNLNPIKIFGFTIFRSADIDNLRF
jgi:hypothetical protein